MAVGRFFWLFMLCCMTAVGQSSHKAPCHTSSYGSHFVVNCSNLGLDRLPLRLPWQHVIGLDASHNVIKKLTADDLRNFTQLRWLNMSSNKLENLDPDTFEGPGSSLTFLDLSMNLFKIVPDASFAPLDHLESLSLSHCAVQEDLGQGFHNLTRLQHLSLTAFSFAGFNATVFSSFVPDHKAVPLEELILDFSQIYAIANFTFSRFSNLTTLSISNVLLSTIEEQSFHGLDSLKYLTLSQNNIENVRNVFTNLTLLESLDLSSNRLVHLDPGMFDDLGMLQTLNLYPNPITRIHNGAFHHQRNLTTLKLGGSGFLLLDTRALEGLINLEDLHMNNAGLANLSTQNLAPLTSLNHISLDFNVMHDLPSDTFHSVRATLRVVSMISCMLTPETLSRGLLRNLPALQHIFLDNNLRLDHIPEDSFDGSPLLKLSVGSSNLSQFPAEIERVRTLTDLDVSFNYIRSLRGKDIDFLRKLENFSGSGNPYNCTCDLWPFMQWFSGARNIADDPTDYRCDSPEKLHNKNFTQFDGAACSTHIPLKYVEIAVSAGGGLVLVLAVAILCWNGRWRCRRALFRRSLVPYVKLEEEDEEAQKQEQEQQRGIEYQYSAFVLHCPRDQLFINQELLPNLELPAVQSEPVFKLAVDFRDALPGSNVRQNVTMLMRSSRKILLLLSGQFLRESWAINHDILVELWHRRKNPFVVVCLEPVEDPAIPAILRESVKITWPGAGRSQGEQDLFWWKVRGALDPLAFATGSDPETSDSL